MSMGGDFWSFAMAVGLGGVVLGNGLWMAIKIINRLYGYRLNLIWSHRDIRDFRRVIEATTDRSRRRRYTLILYALYGCLGSLVVAFAISALCFLVS